MHVQDRVAADSEAREIGVGVGTKVRERETVDGRR